MAMKLKSCLSHHISSGIKIPSKVMPSFVITNLGQKCLPRVGKMPMFQRAGMRVEEEPLPLSFQYLILMI